MNLYNLIEYSDNYSDTSRSLWKYKRDKQNMTAAGAIGNVNTNSSLFKYKSDLLKRLTKKDIGANTDPDIADAHKVFTTAQLVVPLKYLSNFFRSLEMPLLNTKLHLELNWTKNCVMSDENGATTFQITKTKLYVPIVTLPTKEVMKLTKQLSKGFKRSVFWNKYKNKIETHATDNNNLKRILLDSSFQGVNILFFLAYDNTNLDDFKKDSHRKYFLSRVNITKCNVLINGKNFYDQPITHETRKYDEVKMISSGKGEDYTSGCLLDYKYLKDHYQLIVCDLNRQKELDVDPRAAQ